MARREHNPDQHVMSFGDHLEELRLRIILALALPLPLMIILFFFSSTLLKWLVLPLTRVLDHFGLPPVIQVLSPPEALLIELKLAMIAALIFSCPWILWQAWLFIRPGLYHQERRFVYLLLPGSAVLTAAGVALMYFVMLPLMLYVLVGVAMKFDPGQPIDPRIEAVLQARQTIEIRHAPPIDPPADQLWALWPDLKLYASVLDAGGAVEIVEVKRPASTFITQEYHLSRYTSFVLLLFLGIVLAFQMPLVVLLLGWLGLASEQWLQKNRKYALLVLGAISAIITPADVVSMLMMLAPLYGLYELGILLLRIAPASKVAEGRVFDFRRPRKQKSAGDRPGEPGGGGGGAGGPDKPAGGGASADEPAQPDETVERTRPASQSKSPPPDSGDNA
jgi:sec-independent protein translocase protein TatC